MYLAGGTRAQLPGLPPLFVPAAAIIVWMSILGDEEVFSTRVCGQHQRKMDTRARRRPGKLSTGIFESVNNCGTSDKERPVSQNQEYTTLAMKVAFVVPCLK